MKKLLFIVLLFSSLFCNAQMSLGLSYTDVAKMYPNGVVESTGSELSYSFYGVDSADYYSYYFDAGTHVCIKSVVCPRTSSAVQDWIRLFNTDWITVDKTTWRLYRVDGIIALATLTSENNNLCISVYFEDRVK